MLLRKIYAFATCVAITSSTGAIISYLTSNNIKKIISENQKPAPLINMANKEREYSFDGDGGSEGGWL